MTLYNTALSGKEKQEKNYM